MLKEAVSRSEAGLEMPAKASVSEFDFMLPESMLGPQGGDCPRPVIHSHRHNLRSRFELLKTLGEGTYGKVKLAVERATGEEVAIKYIRKKKIQDETDLNRIRREITIMATLNHPHIVNVREVFENKDKIILVMDCATGGELYDYINDHQLTEKEARRIFRQIASAISFCHRNGIVHRDLKLENILLDKDRNAKIADFGLSNYYSSHDVLKTYCGSPLYASPEIVNGQPYHGPEVDCWSLGVVLYTLVYGTMPFDGTNFKKLRCQITTGDYYEPTNPSEAAGLIRHLLTVNPAKRANMTDILSHWWVNLGHREMPNAQPYIPPVVLQPVPACHNQNQNQSLSSDSDGEPDSNKPKPQRPLKGILKKPKMTDTRSQQPKNENNDPFSEEDVTDNSESVFNTSAKDSCQVQQTGAANSPTPESPPCNTDSVFSSEVNGKKVFDSQKMPARSILKRKGKFSAGDSGCDLTDTSRLNSASSRGDSASAPVDMLEGDSALESPDNTGSAASAKDGSNSLNHGAFNFILDDDSHTNIQYDASDVIVVPRRKGILKNKQASKDDTDKRLSTCSLGSNSSADILDFSYDSCDDLLSLKYYRQRSPALVQVGGEEMEEGTGAGNQTKNQDLFNFDEAKEVYKQALDICKNL